MCGGKARFAADNGSVPMAPVSTTPGSRAGVSMDAMGLGASSNQETLFNTCRKVSTDKGLDRCKSKPASLARAMSSACA